MFKKIVAILFLTSWSLCFAGHKYTLSICAIFQDEAPFLREWIEFHKLVGVEHFYLCNHCSNDNYLEVLEPYIQSGLVELTNVLEPCDSLKAYLPLQCACYTAGLKSARGVSKWVAFIDIDEFLFPVKDQSLQRVLANYEEFGGVFANWRMFGTSGVKKLRPDQLLVETLTSCSIKSFRENTYVKSIVRPECATHFAHPHFPIYLEGYYGVNTDRFPFEGPCLPGAPPMSSYHLGNKLRINHYWTRDEDFFYSKKIERQKRWGGTPNPRALIDNLNVEKDLVIQRFVPALKKAMES